MEFMMAADPVDGALLLLKKFGAMILIFFGILGVALGFEYRSNGLSPELIGAGIVALVLGMVLLVIKIIRRNAA
jgi:uncharacterized membrane protein HdeD (DUF308 family)